MKQEQKLLVSFRKEYIATLRHREIEFERQYLFKDEYHGSHCYCLFAVRLGRSVLVHKDTCCRYAAK